MPTPPTSASRFLIDNADLPLKTVFQQKDMLVEEVIPVLRRELGALRPAGVPEAPTHTKEDTR